MNLFAAVHYIFVQLRIRLRQHCCAIDHSAQQRGLQDTKKEIEIIHFFFVSSKPHYQAEF